MGQWVLGGDGRWNRLRVRPGQLSRRGTRGLVTDHGHRRHAGTPDGAGYWLVSASGEVYAFGDARFYGSLPGLAVRPAAPIVAIVRSPVTAGYWLIGADGGTFAFGDAGYLGSLPAEGVHVGEVVAAVPTGP